MRGPYLIVTVRLAAWIQAFRSSAEFLNRHLGSRVPPATSTVQ